MFKQLLIICRKAAPSALILGMTLASQLPGLPGFFLMDDQRLVSSPGFGSAGWLAQIWMGKTPDGVYHYYPLSQSFLAVEFYFFGPHPAYFKIVSFGLHSLNSWILYQFLRAMGFGGALWAALFFALHPLQTQTAQWIIEQNTLLAFCFSAAAGWAISRGKTTESALLFGAALLSKVNAVFAVPVLIGISWIRITSLRSRLIYGFFTAIPALLVGVVALNREGALLPASASDIGFEVGFADGFSAITQGLARYISMALLPLPDRLSFFYPHADLSESRLLWNLIIFPVIGLIAVFVFDRKGLRIHATAAFLGLLWLLPVLGGGLPLAYASLSPVADHFCYWSLAALALAAGRGSDLIAQRVGWPAWIFFSCILLTALFCSTQQSARRYAEPERFWAETIAKNPDSAMAHHEWGVWLSSQGEWVRAESELLTALRLNPEMDLALVNLGNLAFRMNDLRRAGVLYAEALRRNPGRWQAARNLDRVQSLLGKKTDPPTAKKISTTPSVR